MREDKRLALIIIIALAAGIAAGYYYGNSRGVAAGVEKGRQEILAERKRAEEEALKKVQDAANPFSGAEDAANPFKDTYKNPFAQ